MSVANEYTVSDVLKNLPQVADLHPIHFPDYVPVNPIKIMLGVSSMKDHTSDEGYQLQQGLEYAGYTLAGRGLTIDEVDVKKIVEEHNPPVVVIQDKREWDTTSGFRDKTARFENYTYLKSRPDILKLTVLKDSHQRNWYHKQSFEEMGCHGWIIYYHPDIVHRLAPYTDKLRMIRTYHSLNPDHVPQFNTSPRDGAVLSGAISRAYPLRTRLSRSLRQLPNASIIHHPGYHRKGCCTPEYLSMLSKFKVSICTSSRYGYLLRKIIESTACGCMVLTDLPRDERVPQLEDNIYRIRPDASISEISNQLCQMYALYDTKWQETLAEQALKAYNYKFLGRYLSNMIDAFSYDWRI